MRSGEKQDKKPLTARGAFRCVFRKPLFVFETKNVICAVFNLDPVGIVPEARKFAVKGLQRFQIAENGTVRRTGILARHQQRNSGRIRNHAGCHRTVGDLIDSH